MGSEIEFEGRLSTIEAWVREMRENHLPHINSELLWIRKAISTNGKKPGWVVVMVVSGLSSLSVGLLVALATLH